MIEVEKGVPFSGSPKGKYKYPFNKMEVGDSFVVESLKERESAWNCYTNYRGKDGNNGFKIASRRIEDGKFRIWRIA